MEMEISRERMKICEIIKKNINEETSNADKKEFRKSFVQIDFQQFSRSARL